jgi:adenylate cyclase
MALSSSTPPVASVARAFRLADGTSERAAAVIRITILAAIAIAVATAQSVGFDHQPLEAMAGVYAAGTVAGLLIAWRGWFRPWLAYAFVAFDMLTVALTVLMLGRTLGLAPGVPIALPVAGLVIVVLLHASMHYRPVLIVFGAVLFVLAMLVGTLLMPVEAADSAAALRDVAEHHLLHFQWFPIAVFGLVVVILLFTTRHTKRSIADAAEHAARAATLSRYFSPQVAEELTSHAAETALFGERLDVAVVFADVRGFTTMAEGMDPTALARFLSDFRSRIARPVTALGGVVDKYIGDGVMVVFGAPKPVADDARRALACAQAMVEAIDRWSDERVHDGLPPVAIAIGAHWGQVFAGVLSDGRLLEYTVIGDAVNVSSRLARLPRSFDTSLVVSDALVEAAGGMSEPARWEHLPPQTLPGHPHAVSVFAYRGI